MQQESINVEAFNTNLHGCRILCQGPFPNAKYAPIMESIQKLREPFKKKILLTKTAFSLSKYLSLQYDAAFQVRDSQDWSLILTYITYAPKPLLVVAEDIQIPEALWQKITRNTTFVHFSSQNIQNIRPYDAIFFAPIEELNSGFAEFVYRQLQTLYRTNYSQKEYKDILQELRVAGAGVAWTRQGEQQTSGSIYWYDPVENNQGDNLSSKQLSELFGWLSTHFNRN
jgi:hypothetical protein